MSWNNIQTEAHLNDLIQASHARPQLIFKHSTRCGLSSTAKFQLDSALDKLSSAFDLHYLDLLSHRDISNEIAEKLDVIHASPQVIVVQNGKAAFDLSHALVTPRFILDYMERELA
jgi:bacillithiol system protein YtxJ